MAHFAKLGINSTVIAVHSVNDEDCHNADGIVDESVGKQFLERLHGWPLWVMTDYDTWEGVHRNGGTPFRKNYASIGMIWDESKDMFYHAQSFPSWTLNETTGVWDPPTPRPLTYHSASEYDNENKVPDAYDWNENTQEWVKLTN
tara:strand:- start:2607 stop:3041 length:435 start_codon:yes stop_codon:yes gene_type:complete